MKNFHIKSVLLGAGIGFVLCSIISMIYLAGINPNTRMTKEEIINEAKKYGMIEQTELVKTPAASSEALKEKDGNSGSVKIDEPKATTAQPSKTEAGPAKKPQETVNSEVKEITVAVNPGDSSEIVAGRLKKSGLISDTGAFIKELNSLGLTSEINVGVFKIKTGTDIRTIIKIITGK